MADANRAAWQPQDVRSVAGSAAVEFALVLPILVLTLFGIVNFGIYLAIAHGLQQIASEAARATVAGLSNEERGALAVDTVRTLVGSHALLRPEAVAVTALVDSGNPDLMRVTLVYDADYLTVTPGVSWFGLDPSRIERSAVVRRGGF